MNIDVVLCFALCMGICVCELLKQIVVWQTRFVLDEKISIFRVFDACNKYYYKVPHRLIKIGKTGVSSEYMAYAVSERDRSSRT